MADMGAKEKKAKEEKAQKCKAKTQADKKAKKLALDAQHDNLKSRVVSIANDGSQRQLNKFRVFPLANPAQATAQAAATQSAVTQAAA